MTTSVKNSVKKPFFGALGLLIALSFFSFAMARAETLSTFYQQMDPGSSGADVEALQSFLARDTTIYPQGLITGYYGPLTEAAVERYQTAHNLPAVGRVGPLTLAMLNNDVAAANAGSTMSTGASLTASSTPGSGSGSNVVTPLSSSTPTTVPTPSVVVSPPTTTVTPSTTSTTAPTTTASSSSPTTTVSGPAGFNPPGAAGSY